MENQEFISDEDFTELFDHVTGCDWNDSLAEYIADRIKKQKFTYSQLATLCENVDSIRGSFVNALVTRPELDSDHIDLFIRHGGDFDLNRLLVHCQKLTPAHLTACVDTGRYIDMVLVFQHPLCTDAMKVAYHLKLG